MSTMEGQRSEAQDTVRPTEGQRRYPSSITERSLKESSNGSGEGTMRHQRQSRLSALLGRCIVGCMDNDHLYCELSPHIHAPSLAIILTLLFNRVPSPEV